MPFPIKRLVETAVSPDARLIMSSEWKFVPFTYPMTLDWLPGFALVGGPAPESDNVLIVPLAGHEIGHSAWRSKQLKDQLMADRSEEHTSELQSLMRNSYAVFCVKKKKLNRTHQIIAEHESTKPHQATIQAQSIATLINNHINQNLTN